MNALLRKEFRESVRWLPLGWLLMGGMLWAMLPRLDQIENVPYLMHALTFFPLFGSVFIALGLSIAQFSPDQRNSARAFLLHRGLSRTQLFHGKLIIGIAMYALAVWLPLLICTLYLEWIGPFRLPTSARQTIPAWVISVCAFSFYFGGGMVACSNARWVGTRILPLAISCLVTICALSMTLSAPIGLVVLILGFAAFGVYAMYRASQDAFENGARRVAPSTGSRGVWSRNLVLTLASMIASITALLFPAPFVSQNEIYRYVANVFDDEGNAWCVLLEGGYHKARSRISSDPNSQAIEKVSDEFYRLDYSKHMILQPVASNPSTNLLSGSEPASFCSPQILSSSSSEFLVFDPRGYILAYTPVPRSYSGGRPQWLLSYVVSQDRLSRSIEPRGKPFNEKPTVVSPNLLVTRDGLRWFDKEKGTVDHFAKMQVDGYTDVTTMLKHQLFIYSGDKLIEYSKLYNPVSPEAVQPEATIAVGENLTAFGFLCQFWYKDKDNFTLIKSVPLGTIVVSKRPNKDLERFTSKPPKGMQVSNGGQPALSNGLICMAIPVSYYLIIGLFVLIAYYGVGVPKPEFGGDVFLLEWMVPFVVFIAIQVALACILAYVAARHRGLSRRARIGWSIGGALGGFGVALAIIAIYPRCIREACPSCKKMRRVELLDCESCGSQWELPASLGIEVLDEAPTPVCVP